MNQVFDINRTINFAKLKFSQNRKMLVIGLAGYFGLVFIITFFMAYVLSEHNADAMNKFHMAALGILASIGGIWVAGRSFQDMNSPEKSMAQIMVPASTFEKYIVPFVFSTVLWIFAVTAAYQLYAIVLNVLWGGLFGIDFGFFNFFQVLVSHELLNVFGIYLLMHSIFFLGGVAFKRYPIAKTVFSMFLLQLGTSVLSFITMLVLFGSLTGFSKIDNSNMYSHMAELFNLENPENLVVAVKLVVMVVIPAVLYVAAFFKLKEREV